MAASRFSLIFISLTQLSGWLKSRLWRAWYGWLARRDQGGALTFMNYGYAAPGEEVALQPADEPQRYPIQLYAHVMSSIDLAGRDLAEVGCGRGGGGDWLVRTQSPRSYTGIDLAPSAIAWCAQRFPHANAQWRVGRADALPLADASMDVVVNVESSHCYPSMTDFLREVKRVLRPGGVFAFCDLRTKAGMDELAQQLAESGMRVEAARTITPQVLHALDLLTTEREAGIARQVPRWLQPAFRDFAGVKGSGLYDMFADGRMGYMSCRLRKPA
jgi:SAM-dependent methyltransferase